MKNSGVKNKIYCKDCKYAFGLHCENPNNQIVYSYTSPMQGKIEYAKLESVNNDYNCEYYKVK